MPKIVADDAGNGGEDIESLRRRIQELEAANAAREARAAKQPGFYPRNGNGVPKPPAKPKPGSKPGKYAADRMLHGGLSVSFYVGGNGKLTVGGVYGTRGMTLWGPDRAAVVAYVRDTGPDGFDADLARIAATGTWADRGPEDAPAAE